MQLIREYSHLYHNPNHRMGYGIPNYYKLYLEHGNSVSEQKNSPFTVYPNPTTGVLNIQGIAGQARNDVRNVEVFDISGRKQSSHHLIPSSSHLIDISHLSPGIYFLRIISDNSVEMVKVVKR